MKFFDKAQFGESLIRKIAVIIRYGKTETTVFVIALALFSAGTWLITSDSKVLKAFENLRLPVSVILFVFCFSRNWLWGINPCILKEQQ